MKPVTEEALRVAREACNAAVTAMAEEFTLDRRALVTGYVMALRIRIERDFPDNGEVHAAVATLLLADVESNNRMFTYRPEGFK